MDDYAAVPYRGQVYQETHPASLAAIAHLFGHQSRPADRWRVLEIGCGEATNLANMALTLPAAEFVGVDVSPTALASARALVVALRLPNVTLLLADLAHLPPDLGTFDFVVAHGVYSWVPSATRSALLNACANHLRADGLAYISFNARPGSTLNGLIREILLTHVAGISDPAVRVEEALRALDLLAETPPTATEPYANLVYYLAGQLSAELQPLGSARRGFVAHDLIAPENHAFSLAEFARDAAAHGLAYLAPADYPLLEAADVTTALAAGFNLVNQPPLRRQQLADLLTGRGFHRALLCRGAAAEREPRAATMADLWLASSAVVDDDALFTTPIGQVNLPPGPARAVLERLVTAWPRPMAARAVLETLALSAAEQAELLATLLDVLAGGSGVLRVLATPVVVAQRVGERPVASPLARRLAAVSRRLPTAYHETLEVDDWTADVLAALDGRRDRDALLAHLERAWGGEAATRLEATLHWLAAVGFLVPR